MSNGGAQSASGVATYRTVRELGSRSPRSYAAVREPSELVVIHRFSRSSDPRAKTTASFVSADGGITVGSEALANLARDARCLAKNWHPNIARVRHVDLAGDELTVATELVDGTTLADLLEAARRARGATVALDEPLLPLPVLVRILVDVVTGLSGLHGLRDEKGVPLGTIHGALSPANILVGKDGVARLINALRPRPLRAAAGTEAVGYAAPEALDLGATQDVRADLHSVGVITWEALTGRRLYAETDPARVLARQREEDVPPPAFPSGSPFARLAEVTRQAMAFDAGMRFKTAAELGAALRNIAATRIATGSVVASRVAELGGERIRARRLELDPGATGKHRLPSDRALRAAKPVAAAASAPAPMTAPARAAAPAPVAAAGTERETLPPVSMDASELGPESSRPLDLSVRDFLAVGEAPSTPALAAAAPKQTLIGHAAPATPPAASVEKGSTERGIGRPAPPLIRKTAPAAPASSPALKASPPAPPPPPASSPALKASPPPIQAAPVVVEAPPAFVAAPVAGFDDLSLPAAPAPQAGYAPRAADAPIVHSTPDAFTPPDASPPQTRRSLVGVVLGVAIALLLVVGFFAVRSLLGDTTTKTTTATVAPSSEASANGNATASATASATAEADKPNEEAKPETPPAESAAAAAEPAAAEPAAAAAPEPAAAPATATAVAPATATAPEPGTETAPAAAAPTEPSTVGKPPASGPPKKRTYEPLGI